MSGPYKGVRVLELTSTVSGPFAGMMLADQGAEVIKIEPPGIGDLARFMGTIKDGMGAMFSTLNRNKKCICLDFKNAFLKSRHIHFLFLLRVENIAPIPSFMVPMNLAKSPIPGGSIFITSAPWSANIIPAKGPETVEVSSRTLTPLYGPLICLP